MIDAVATKAPRMHLPASPIRIVVVDDHPALREGLVSMLGADARFAVVGAFGSAEAGLDAYPALRPDIMIMDLQMPGMGGLEGIRALRGNWPTARAIVLTTYRGDANAQEAIVAGATGYLLKSALADELADCLLRVHAGGRYISAEVCAEIAAHLGEDRLTAREKRVLELIAEGMENKRIADALEISTETVKSHLSTLFDKLGAHNRSEAIRIGIRRGMLMNLDR